MLDKLKTTAKHSIIYSIANLAAKMSGLILLPIYATHISIHDYGLLALFEIIFEILSSISIWGLGVALPRWYFSSEAKDKQKELFFTSLIFILLSSLVILASSFFVMNSYDTLIFSEKVNQTVIVIFILSVFTRVLMRFAMLLMRTQQKAAKQTIYNLVYLAILVFLTVYFLSSKQLGVIGIFWAQLISSGFICLMLIPYIKTNSKFKLELGILKSMIKFSSPVLISTLLTLILTLSDRYILAYFGSLADTGEYQIAYKISNVVKLILIQSFMNALAPLYYKDMEGSDTSRFFTKTLTYFIYFSIWLSLGLVLFSREILKVFSLNNADYMNAYLIIPVLIFGIIFNGMRQFIALPLFKHKMTKFTAIVSVSSGILNLILNIIFIPIWGVLGAALTTSVTQLIVVITYYRAAKKVEPVRMETKKIILLFCLGSALYFTSMIFFEYSVTFRLFLKSILFLVFPILLFLFHFYENVELERIKQAWKKWSNIKSLVKNISRIKIK